MKKILFLLLFVCSTAFAEETYRVQVLTNTKVDELGGNYADAQYLTVPMTMTLEEVKNTYGTQVKEEESKRIQARIDDKNNTKPIYEPSKEELEEAKAQLIAQVAELDAKIVTAKPKGEKLVAEEVIA